MAGRGAPHVCRRGGECVPARRLSLSLRRPSGARVAAAWRRRARFSDRVLGRRRLRRWQCAYNGGRVGKPGAGCDGYARNAQRSEPVRYRTRGQRIIPPACVPLAVHCSDRRAPRAIERRERCARSAALGERDGVQGVRVHDHRLRAGRTAILVLRGIQHGGFRRPSAARLARAAVPVRRAVRESRMEGHAGAARRRRRTDRRRSTRGGAGGVSAHFGEVLPHAGHGHQRGWRGLLPMGALAWTAGGAAGTAAVLGDERFNAARVDRA